MLCGVCSAAMLLGAVTFSASAAAAFTDVKPTDYFAKPVEWAVQNGITAGVSDTQFGPNQSCTRAQAMTFLWAAAGRPEPTASASFSDVKSTDYFAKAVAWAVENGITAGVGGGKFGANQPCTRGQIMTFLWRFGGSEEIQGGVSFSDVSSSDYFAKPVAWAVKNEVTAGIGGGKFGPNQTCTRGQIMTMLWRADQIDAPVVPEPEKPTEPAPTPSEPKPTEPAPTEPEPTDHICWEEFLVHETTAPEEYDEPLLTCTCGFKTPVSPNNWMGYKSIDAFWREWHVKYGGDHSTPAGTNKPPRPGECHFYTVTPIHVKQQYWDSLVCSVCGRNYGLVPPEGSVPLEPIPTESGHEHTWVRGAYEAVMRCSWCGWSCTESQAELAGLDLGQYYYVMHNERVENGLTEHSYDTEVWFNPDSLHSDCWVCGECGERIMDAPVGEHIHQWLYMGGTLWICDICGKEVQEDPYSGHDHIWKHQHTDKTEHTDFSIACSCGAQTLGADAKKYDMSLEQYWKKWHATFLGAIDGQTHTNLGMKEIWVIDTAASDTWVCTECGKVEMVDPNHA